MLFFFSYMQSTKFTYNMKNHLVFLAAVIAGFDCIHFLIKHLGFLAWFQRKWRNGQKTELRYFSTNFFVCFFLCSLLKVKRPLSLVACYATLQPALSVRPSARPSYRPLVRPSHFNFLGVLRSLASLLLPKWWRGLKYGPCPPARDLGSRVSGLVTS